MYRNLLLLILMLCSYQCAALSKLGHQLVCQLSFEHLSVQKQQQIHDLLAKMPKLQQHVINKYNHLPEQQTISFANACTWADAIKNEPAFARFKSWHYLNIARTQLFINDNACISDCVPQAILFHQQQLSSASDEWEKIQALMFVGHWLGDIHQPLHVAFASDLGGNKSNVRAWDDQCNTLHWLWDDCLLTKTGLSKSQWQDQLARQWQTAPIALWQQSTVWQWANESLQLIRQSEFGYCQLNNNRRCEIPAQSVVILADNYREIYRPVMAQRLLQAAVRLTMLLNQAL